ncbi:hypothetical protein ACQPWW_31095 [Micromonospora sp. CA-240977]
MTAALHGDVPPPGGWTTDGILVPEPWEMDIRSERFTPRAR